MGELYNGYMGKPQTEKIASTAPYSEAYKERCKVAWYDGGRPDSMTRILEIVPEDEHGRKPHRTVLVAWRDENGWDVWADELDVRADMEIDDFLISQRVKMLKEQATVGREMRVKGMNHLREQTGFDTSASAVTAVIQGAKLERSSLGISEKLEKLLLMDSDDLTKEAVKLLGIAKDSGEILDIELEDIEEDDTETDE